MLSKMQKVSPCVVFEDSPIAYLSLGQQDAGHRLSMVLGMDTSVGTCDQHTITYRVLSPGGKLVGEIQSSDSFGVELILDDFFEAAEKKLAEFNDGSDKRKSEEPEERAPLVDAQQA